LNILVIDTATKIEVVSVLAGNTVSDKTMNTGLSHAATLFSNIDLALQEANIDLRDLNIIGVGTGPGSFTGIRIAVTTARMLAQLLNLPLVGIKTPLMYACSAEAGPEENILIAFDAKKGRVFGALYKKSGHELKPVEIIRPGDYRIEQLTGKADMNKKTLLIGDGCGKYYEEIKSAIKDHALLKDFRPSGRKICELVKTTWLKNPDEYSDLNKILPFYARRSDAEIIKELKTRNKS
jgi:tRNA threonylcarbamoyladenosine biosynthesis protein TsaB